MNKLAILIIVEPGLLELQAKLLIESIDKFLAIKIPVDVFTFSPRTGRKPAAETLVFLNQHVKQHINLDLNEKYDYFPLANGLYASRYFEANFSGYEHVLLTDTDTVFLNCLPAGVFEYDTLFLSPADNKGVGSTGPSDSNDLFWKAMFDYFKLQLPEPELETTVRTEIIRSYHNSGFVLANNLPGFFTQWFDDFDALMESGLKPEFVGRDGTNFGFFEQLVLSITAARYPGQVKYFPQTINYPIPFRPYLASKSTHLAWCDLVHIHYHKWFQHPGFLDHVTTAADKQTKQYLWLKQQLPLKPQIDGPFKC